MEKNNTKLTDLLREYYPNVYLVADKSLSNYDAPPQDVESVKFTKKSNAEKGRHPGLISNVRDNTSSLIVSRETSPFKYFLDGCRRTYYLCDIASASGRVIPVIAGQYSAAVIKRDNAGDVSLFRYNRYAIIVFLTGGNGLNKGDCDELCKKINNSFPDIDLRAVSVDLKNQHNETPQDASIARINMEMQALEVGFLEELSKKRIIDERNMIIVDGALQFKRKTDPTWAFLGYALGISKHFNQRLEGLVEPHKQIGVHLLGLTEVGQRTTAFRLKDSSTNIDYLFWYLRIQPCQYLNFPFAGIIRVEKALTTSRELDEGIETSVIDYLSAHILHERSVNPYGLDFRWASHLYPIYLTEQIQKQKFLSDYHFNNLLNRRVIE